MMATTIRVGNLLGEGRPRQARLAGRVSVTLCCGMMLVSCVVLFFFRNSFGKVYSSDPEVIAAASEVVPQLAPYLVAFGMTMSFRGTIGGCGKQVVSAKLGLFTWVSEAQSSRSLCVFFRSSKQRLHSTWSVCRWARCSASSGGSACRACGPGWCSGRGSKSAASLTGSGGGWTGPVRASAHGRER